MKDAVRAETENGQRPGGTHPPVRIGTYQDPSGEETDVRLIWLMSHGAVHSVLDETAE